MMAEKHRDEVRQSCKASEKCTGIDHTDGMRVRVSDRINAFKCMEDGKHGEKVRKVKVGTDVDSTKCKKDIAIEDIANKINVPVQFIQGKVRRGVDRVNLIFEEERIKAIRNEYDPARLRRIRRDKISRYELGKLDIIQPIKTIEQQSQVASVERKDIGELVNRFGGKKHTYVTRKRIPIYMPKGIVKHHINKFDTEMTEENSPKLIYKSIDVAHRNIGNSNAVPRESENELEEEFKQRAHDVKTDAPKISATDQQSTKVYENSYVKNRRKSFQGGGDVQTKAIDGLRSDGKKISSLIRSNIKQVKENRARMNEWPAPASVCQTSRKKNVEEATPESAKLSRDEKLKGMILVVNALMAEIRRCKKTTDNGISREKRESIPEQTFFKSDESCLSEKQPTLNKISSPSILRPKSMGHVIGRMDKINSPVVNIDRRMQTPSPSSHKSDHKSQPVTNAEFVSKLDVIDSDNDKERTAATISNLLEKENYGTDVNDVDASVCFTSSKKSVEQVREAKQKNKLFVVIAHISEIHRCKNWKDEVILGEKRKSIPEESILKGDGPFLSEKQPVANKINSSIPRPKSWGHVTGGVNKINSSIVNNDRRMKTPSLNTHIVNTDRRMKTPSSSTHKCDLTPARATIEKVPLRRNSNEFKASKPVIPRPKSLGYVKDSVERINSYTVKNFRIKQLPSYITNKFNAKGQIRQGSSAREIIGYIEGRQHQNRANDNNSQSDTSEVKSEADQLTNDMHSKTYMSRRSNADGGIGQRCSAREIIDYIEGRQHQNSLNDNDAQSDASEKQSEDDEQPEVDRQTEDSEQPEVDQLINDKYSKRSMSGSCNVYSMGNGGSEQRCSASKIIEHIEGKHNQDIEDIPAATSLSAEEKISAYIEHKPVHCSFNEKNAESADKPTRCSAEDVSAFIEHKPLRCSSSKISNGNSHVDHRNDSNHSLYKERARPKTSSTKVGHARRSADRVSSRVAAQFENVEQK
jgi:hypothetical protein